MEKEEKTRFWLHMRPHMQQKQCHKSSNFDNVLVAYQKCGLAASESMLGADSLGQLLGKNPNLEILNLYNNQITDEGCLKICVGLQENKHLTDLNLGLVVKLFCFFS